MKLIDFDHPFFEPLWRRIAIVVFCLGWSIFEFATAAPFWGILFGGFGLVAGWSFFVSKR